MLKILICYLMKYVTNYILQQVFCVNCSDIFNVTLNPNNSSDNHIYKCSHLWDPIADTTSLSLRLASSALCNLLMLLAERGGLRNPLEYWYDDGCLEGEANGDELPLASKLNLVPRTLRFLEDPLSKSDHIGPLWLRCS